MFSRGMPGLTPPPTERMMPSPSDPFEHVERRLLHFVRRAAHRDLQRVDVAHQAHAVADALLHLADVLLLAPVQHVEPGIRQMIQAGVDFGVVVIDLHPVLRERVADALQVRVRELHVVLFVDEADDVVEDEDAFDGVAHHLVLRLQPVDDHARAQVDQLVRALRDSPRARSSSSWCCGRIRPCRADRAQSPSAGCSRDRGCAA